MIRRGIVESVKDGMLLIVLTDASCDGCSTPCGACRREQKPQTIRLANTLGAREGDNVEISCPDSGVVLFSVLLFLVPILLGVGSYFLYGNFFGEAQRVLFAALTAVASFVLFSLLLSLPAVKNKNRFSLLGVSKKNGDEKELDK